jgi:hypothetical protein
MFQPSYFIFNFIPYMIDRIILLKVVRRKVLLKALLDKIFQLVKLIYGRLGYTFKCFRVSFKDNYQLVGGFSDVFDLLFQRFVLEIKLS